MAAEIAMEPDLEIEIRSVESVEEEGKLGARERREDRNIIFEKTKDRPHTHSIRFSLRFCQERIVFVTGGSTEFWTNEPWILTCLEVPLLSL